MIDHSQQRTNGVNADALSNGFPHGPREQVIALCRQTAKTIVETFGDICEVVIHDFADIEHSVVHIEGNVTNRSVGAGPTDLLLKAVRSGRTEQDLYGYTGTTLDGKALRSSSMFLRDEAGYVFGAFCINVDVTQFQRLNAWTAQMIGSTTTAEASETFTSDLVEVLEVMLAETAMEIGVPLAHMNRAQKIRLVQALQERGGFQIKKAVTVVAERLGVSRFTVYNYLNTSAEELRRLETDEG
jgi:predicted transcriptional regulator YheO